MSQEKSYIHITKKNEDFSRWYLDVIRAADLVEYGPVRGTMIIKPNGYEIWESIKDVINKKFKEVGVRNAYFPLLIPERFLNKEKDHVEGFSPEVAAVTYAGGKRLKEALIIRPTSETIIYDAFARWVESYRDLPIVINQWANIVRWEMRPRLFLRTTEFLWQEGHTAHEKEEEAEDMALLILNLYKDFFQKYLAIPVFNGLKPEYEKFAGAQKTYSLEGMMQDGKALQLATSHNLGTNFSKAFNVEFVGRNGDPQYAWQTSWGLSTRTIGGMIMSHGDDKGIIIPPKIATKKAVIIPIRNDEDNDGNINSFVKKTLNLFDEFNFEGVVVDDGKSESPGEKFYKWEKRGVPLRIEIGIREIKTNSVVLVRRDNGEKRAVKIESLYDNVIKLLDLIQDNLYNTALKRNKDNTVSVETWREFKSEISKGKFVKAFCCCNKKVLEKIKKETSATPRVLIEDNQTTSNSNNKCIYSGEAPGKLVLFAKAY